MGVSPEPELWLVDLAAAERPLRALEAAHRLLPATGSRASDGGGKDVARIALRALLAGRLGLDAARLPFVLEAAGKPRLAPAAAAGGLEFSLAHCESAALVALSVSGPVGVDIEAGRPVRIDPGRRALLEAAAGTLSPGEPLPCDAGERRFLQAWVRLEALAKATGEGISGLLARLGVRGRTLLPAAGARPSAPTLQVRDVAIDDLPGLCAAVAASTLGPAPATPAPRLRRLRPDADWLESLVSGRH